MSQHGITAELSYESCASAVSESRKTELRALGYRVICERYGIWYYATCNGKAVPFVDADTGTFSFYTAEAVWAAIDDTN